MKAWFTKAANATAEFAGGPWASLGALLIVLGWTVAGFFIGFTDTMQLVISTITTIITFLMVFLIQASQNHDTRAMHLKMDEILRALDNARTELAGAEDLSAEEIKQQIEDIKQT